MTPYKYPLEEFDFVALAKQSRDSKEKARLLILANLQDGKGQEVIADMFKIDVSTVKRTLRNFKISGIGDLCDRYRSGAPRKLAKSEHPAVKEYIIQMQENLPGGRITGYDVQQVLLEKWGVVYSLTTVYGLMHSMNLSWITSRSRHPKQDKEVQESFKKTSVNRP
ncbi:MAG: helix-turn-helix domain-containing protein [Candidatus Electrothrix sp. YB6]